MAGNRTPGLSTLLKRFSKQISSELRVMIPGKIVTYDEESQLATVQPLPQEPNPVTKLTEDLPILENVPVWHLRCGLAVIYIPIRPGDPVKLEFSDKSLDVWMDSGSGGTYDPQDVRSHDLTDVIAVPGMYSPDNPILNVDPADIRIVLYDTSGNVRSQFYLGGDTGDIVLVPENLVQIGAAIGAEKAAMGESNKDFLQDLTDKIDTNNAAINAIWLLLTAHVHPVTAVGSPTGPSPTLTGLTNMVDPADPTNALLATKAKLT